MEQNKITFFKEKKWIMALWFKRQKKHPLRTENQMMEQWKKWWADDFLSSNDERFKDAFKFVKEAINTMSSEEIRKKRHDIAYNTSVPQSLQRKANAAGYYIKKSSTSMHPFTVSGFAIFKKKTDKKPIYGNKFSLTISQVRKFLNEQEKNNGYNNKT